MSCRAAAWGSQWAHWADTETVRLATITWRQLLVRGRFKEPGFCLLCSHCLPVRGWAPKENKSSGSPDVYICACVSCLQANTHIWPSRRACFMFLKRHKNLQRRDFYGKDYFLKHTQRVNSHVTCSLMLAHDADWKWFGVISVLSISSSKHWCWQK